MAAKAAQQPKLDPGVPNIADAIMEAALAITKVRKAAVVVSSGKSSSSSRSSSSSKWW